MAEKKPSEQKKPNEIHPDKLEEKDHLNDKKPLPAFPEPRKKSKEDMKKVPPPKEESDEEEEKEERDSEDYSSPPEEEEDVSIDYDGIFLNAIKLLNVYK